MASLCTLVNLHSPCNKIHFFLQTVDTVAQYIQHQNHEIYEQRGITFGDPMDRGLRCVSFLYTLNITFPLSNMIHTVAGYIQCRY